MPAIDYTLTKKPLPLDRSTIVEEDSLIKEEWTAGLTHYKCIYCHRTYRNKDVALAHVYKYHILNAAAAVKEEGESQDAVDTY